MILTQPSCSVSIRVSPYQPGRDWEPRQHVCSLLLMCFQRSPYVTFLPQRAPMEPSVIQSWEQNADSTTWGHRLHKGEQLGEGGFEPLNILSIYPVSWQRYPIHKYSTFLVLFLFLFFKALPTSVLWEKPGSMSSRLL